MTNARLVTNVGPSDIVSRGFSTIIYGYDVNTLQSKAKLNDEVINYYLQLLEEECSNSNYPIKIMSSFFYLRLRQKSAYKLDPPSGRKGRNLRKKTQLEVLKTFVNHTGVARFTRRIDLLRRKLVLVPLHLFNDHWTLAVARITNVIVPKQEVKKKPKKLKAIKKKHVHLSYLDSCRNYGVTHLNNIKKYLRIEHFQNRKQWLDPKVDFTTVEQPVPVPLQRGDKDCGVHMCALAFCLCHQIPLTTFQTKDMFKFRLHMAWSIKQNKIMNFFDYS